MSRVTIDPITRLEGHGRIEIFLDDDGNVRDAFFQVPELRGFERFCVGRQAEDMPLLTSRICGVCPEAHLLASVKALDALFDAPPPLAARKLRELLYSAFYVTDHTTHFFALGGVDLLLGPDAPPAERNVLGVVRKVGLQIGKQVLDTRQRNHDVIRRLGGRAIHPVGAVPGGWSVPLAEADRDAIAAAAARNVEFAAFALQLFEDAIWAANAEMFASPAYVHRTYSMGTVDSDHRVAFYDGDVRVVDPEGVPFLRYAPRDYATHVAEHVEPWSYLKFPYLRAVGWKGLEDGRESGVYTATPLARLNVSEGMATPRAQDAYTRFYERWGSRRVDGRWLPVHHRMATHHARLVELLYAAERMAELAADPEITSRDVWNVPSGAARPGPAVGSVEAPRGTLTHHYEADERGVITRVNLVVGTTNNNAAICMSVKRAAQAFVRGGDVIEEGLLNRVEMAFRLYDPCLSCATHSLPGQMPVTVVLRGPDGATLRTVVRS